jgi:hypothetical protein
MGGLDPVVAKATDAEVRQRLIDIGSSAGLRAVHTVWCVEDPSPNGPFYKDRSDVDNICYAIDPIQFETFYSGVSHLFNKSVALYRYEHREEAVADAVSRLARMGRRCRFCHGAVHPASGCQYTETFIVCGTCIQPYQDVRDVNNKLPPSGLPGYLQTWTAQKGSKRLREKHPEAKGFYEAAGKFLGQDNRQVRT